MMTRRGFTACLVSVGAAVAAGIVGVPAMITGLSPALQGRRREDWRPVGRLDDFPVGQIRTATVTSNRKSWPRPMPQQAVFVWRPSSDEFIVLSRSCTDLACPLNYDPGSECFFCPCHGGIFAKDGAVMAGPPNRPMDRYADRIRDGVIEIDVVSLPSGM